MKNSGINACILRVGGTNCDAETKLAFEVLGVNADLAHLKRIYRNKNLLDYNILVFPGGFSYGDYVRAGSIFGKEIVAKLGNDIKKFVEDGRPVIGICNGFQILVEAGLLPAFDGISSSPQAALANNESARFECRWVYMRNENSKKCIFTKKLTKNKVVRMPVAHGEGRFLLQKKDLQKLIDNEQVVFKYCKQDGEDAEGEYPFNPNGSVNDIAGICNPEGNVFALMPHPERAFFSYQYPDWTSKGVNSFGDGKYIFDSIIEHMKKKF